MGDLVIGIDVGVLVFHAEADKEVHIAGFEQ
jgi:hypothetical protein